MPLTGLPDGPHQSRSPRSRMAQFDGTSINFPVFFKFSLLYKHGFSDRDWQGVGLHLSNPRKLELKHHSHGRFQDCTGEGERMGTQGLSDAGFGRIPKCKRKEGEHRDV